MTEPVQIAIVTSIASCIISGVAAYFAYKSKATAAETKAIVLNMSRKPDPVKQNYEN